LPLALARARGFRRANDSIWRATVDFAFSPANPRFFAGETGGLGSRHNARSLALAGASMRPSTA
jgi:meiotically up-regulated gene 157 (Mug157) protein